MPGAEERKLRPDGGQVRAVELPLDENDAFSHVSAFCRRSMAQRMMYGEPKRQNGFGRMTNDACARSLAGDSDSGGVTSVTSTQSGLGLFAGFITHGTERY